MSLFTSSKTARTEAAAAARAENPALPDDFDDPASDWFVPEDRREYYKLTEDEKFTALASTRYLAFARESAASDRYLQLAAEQAAAVDPAWNDDRKVPKPRAGVGISRQPPRVRYSADVPWDQRLSQLQRQDPNAENFLPQPGQLEKIEPRHRNLYLHSVALQRAGRTLALLQQEIRRDAEAAEERRRWTADHRCELCETVAPSVATQQITPARSAQVDPYCQRLLADQYDRELGARQVNGRTLADRAKSWLSGAA